MDKKWYDILWYDVRLVKNHVGLSKSRLNLLKLKINGELVYLFAMGADPLFSSFPHFKLM